MILRYHFELLISQLLDFINNISINVNLYTVNEEDIFLNIDKFIKIYDNTLDENGKRMLKSIQDIKNDLNKYCGEQLSYLPEHKKRMLLKYNTEKNIARERQRIESEFNSLKEAIKIEINDKYSNLHINKKLDTQELEKIFLISIKKEALK